MLLLFLLSVFITWAHSRETENYVIRKIEKDSCPIIGYYMEKESPKNGRDVSKNSLEGDTCYLCFCHSDETAICWPRENKRCDGVAIGDNSSIKRLKRSPGFTDIFFKDAARAMFGISNPQECKPNVDSKSEGCPPTDWCVGCTVCDCDANGKWKCRILNFCPEEIKPETTTPKRRRYVNWRQRYKTTKGPSTTTVTSRTANMRSKKSYPNRTTAINTKKTNKPVNAKPKVGNQKSMNTKFKPSVTKSLNKRTTKIKSNTTQVKIANNKNGPIKTAIKRTVFKTGIRNKTTPKQKKTQVIKLQKKKVIRNGLTSNKQTTKRITNSVKATTKNDKMKTTTPISARLTDHETKEIAKYVTNKLMSLMRTMDNKTIENQTQKLAESTMVLRSVQSQVATSQSTKERYKTKSYNKGVSERVKLKTEKISPPVTPRPQINNDEEEPAFDSHEFTFRKKRHIAKHASLISEIATEGPGVHSVLEENMIERNVTEMETKIDSNLIKYTIPENYYKYSSNNHSKLKTGNDETMEDKEYLNNTGDIEINPRDHGKIITTESTLSTIKIKETTDVMRNENLNIYSVISLGQPLIEISPIKVPQNITFNNNETDLLNDTETIIGLENTTNLSVGLSTQDRSENLPTSILTETPLPVLPYIDNINIGNNIELMRGLNNLNFNKSTLVYSTTIINPVSKSYQVNTDSTLMKMEDSLTTMSDLDSNDNKSGENEYQNTNKAFIMKEDQKEVIKKQMANSRFINPITINQVSKPYQINTVSTLIIKEDTPTTISDFDSNDNKTGENLYKHTNKTLIMKENEKVVIKTQIPNTRFNYPITVSQVLKPYQINTVSTLIKIEDTPTTISDFYNNKNNRRENLGKNMDKNFSIQEDQKKVTNNQMSNLKFNNPITMISPKSKPYQLNTISTSMKMEYTPTTISDFYSNNNYMRENIYKNFEKNFIDKKNQQEGIKNQMSNSRFNDDLKTKKQHLVRLVKMKIPVYDLNEKYIDQLTKHQKRSTQLVETTESMQDNKSNIEHSEPMQSSHKSQNIFISKVVKLNNFKSEHSHILHKYPPDFGQIQSNYNKENGYKNLFVSKSMKDNFHELQNLINILIHKGTNNTLKVNNFYIANETSLPLKYLKSLFTKKFKNQRKLRTFKEHSFEGHQMVKLTKLGFNKMICKSGIGPCNVATAKKESINNTINDMKNETKNILDKVGVIKRLLNTLKLKYNVPKNYKEDNQSTKLDETEIIKAILNEKESDMTDTTQLIQKQYLKENADSFVKSINKFAALLENLVHIIDNDNSNSNNLIRIIRHARKKHKYYPKPNANNTLENLKQLLRNYNLVQNTFINKMYEAIERFERKEQNNLMANAKIKSFNRVNLKNAFEVEQYTKKIIKSLRKLKELAQRLQTNAGNTRVKRNVEEDTDVTDYMFLLMEYLLKKPLDTRPANDGIDVLIETIRGAPDIRDVRKRVLENSKRLDPYLSTTMKSFEARHNYYNRKDLEGSYFSTTMKNFYGEFDNDVGKILKDSTSHDNNLLTTKKQNYDLKYENDMSIAMDENYFNGTSLKASKEKNKNIIYESPEYEEDGEEYFQPDKIFLKMGANDSKNMSDSNQLSDIENSFQNVDAVTKIVTYRHDEPIITVTTENYENKQNEFQTELSVKAVQTFSGDKKVHDGDDRPFEDLVDEIEEFPFNNTANEITTDITTTAVSFAPNESDGKKQVPKSTNHSNSDSTHSDSINESKPQLVWIDESVDSNSLESKTNGTWRDETTTEKCEEHDATSTTKTSSYTVIIPYRDRQDSSKSSDESDSGEINMEKKPKMNPTEVLNKKNANLMNFLDYGLDTHDHDDSEKKGNFNDDKEANDFQNDF